MKNKFYFEMTDTFSGELNYCWIERFEVEAKTLLGALRKISQHTGYNFRSDGMIGDFEKLYKARKACVALYEISEHNFDGTIFKDWLVKAKKL